MPQLTTSFTSFPRLGWVRIGVFCLIGMLWSLVAMAQTPDAAKSAQRKLLILCQGPDGHPATTHEYVAGAQLLAKLLRPVPNLSVEVLHADGAWEDGPDKLRSSDGAFLFLSQGAKWIHEEPRRIEAFAQLAARGGGLSTLHWGMGTKEPQFIDGFLKLFGGCHGGPDRKYQVLETNLAFVDQAHEIASGLGEFRAHDEFYYDLKLVAAKETLKPIVTADIEGRHETVAWAWDRGDGGRSFGFSGCHFHKNWELPQYRRLVAQGILWTMKLPIPKEGLAVDVSPEDLQLPQ